MIGLMFEFSSRCTSNSEIGLLGILPPRITSSAHARSSIFKPAYFLQKGPLMPQPILTNKHLEILRNVDSPTIANVIELFNVRSCAAGYSNLKLKALYPELPPAVGYAVTLTFRSAYAAESGDSYGGMPQIIADSMSLPEPRMVVFQDLDEPPQAATFGEVMAASFQKFGFAGLITSVVSLK